MAKTDLAIASPGSRALKNSKYEKYCRLRAALQPRDRAFREAGWESSNSADAHSNACRLERRSGIKDRIEYLSKKQEELIPAKRQRLESQLWEIAEADIGNYFETVEIANSKAAIDETGKLPTVKKQRPKFINDLAPEHRRLIEDVTVDRNGNFVPRLYSRTQANAALCKLLNFGRTDDRPETDISRFSDAELIAQLADQAKQLGVDIKLDYTFAQSAPTAAETAEATETEAGSVIDGDSKVVEPTAADSGANAGNERDLQAAREFAIAAQPAIPLRRQGPAEAGARKLNKAVRNDKR